MSKNSTCTFTQKGRSPAEIHIQNGYALSFTLAEELTNSGLVGKEVYIVIHDFNYQNYNINQKYRCKFDGLIPARRSMQTTNEGNLIYYIEHIDNGTRLVRNGQWVTERVLFRTDKFKVIPGIIQDPPPEDRAAKGPEITKLQYRKNTIMGMVREGRPPYHLEIKDGDRMVHQESINRSGSFSIRKALNQGSYAITLSDAAMVTAEALLEVMPETIACFNCKQNIPKAHPICPHCEANNETKEIKCQNCGRYNRARAKYCRFCGEALKKKRGFFS